jgi:hypothetical protein
MIVFTVPAIAARGLVRTTRRTAGNDRDIVGVTGGVSHILSGTSTIGGAFHFKKLKIISHSSSGSGGKCTSFVFLNFEDEAMTVNTTCLLSPSALQISPGKTIFVFLEYHRNN